MQQHAAEHPGIEACGGGHRGRWAGGGREEERGGGGRGGGGGGGGGGGIHLVDGGKGILVRVDCESVGRNAAFLGCGRRPLRLELRSNLLRPVHCLKVGRAIGGLHPRGHFAALLADVGQRPSVFLQLLAADGHPLPRRSNAVMIRARA